MSNMFSETTLETLQNCASWQKSLSLLNYFKIKVKLFFIFLEWDENFFKFAQNNKSVNSDLLHLLFIYFNF